MIANSCSCGQKWQRIKVNTDTKINKLNSIFYWQLGQLHILPYSGGNVTTNAYFVSNNKLLEPYLSFFYRDCKLQLLRSKATMDDTAQWHRSTQKKLLFQFAILIIETDARFLRKCSLRGELDTNALIKQSRQRSHDLPMEPAI